jgi:hypothetical protein
MASALLAASACKRKPEAAEVHVTLKEAPGALSSATVLVDYSRASATPVRSAGEPACAAIAPNVTGHFTDDGQGNITIHASAREGFSAPIDLAVCRMIPDEAGITADTISSRLRVSLVSATDVAGKPVEERRSAHAEGGGVQGHAPLDEAGNESGRPPHRERLDAERRNATEEGEHAAQGTPAGERMAKAPTPGQPGAGTGTETEKPRSLIPENEDRSAARTPPADANRGGNDADQGQGDDSAGREDSNEDTDTDPKAIAYELTVSVKNAIGNLGALQFNIVHQGQGGGFAGARGTARCRSMVPSALASFNDVGNGTLRAGIIDVSGFATPGAVVSCTFKSRETVSSGDFGVEVIDATDPELKHRDPQLAVTDIARLDQ